MAHTDALFYLTTPAGVRPLGARCVTVGRARIAPGEHYPADALSHPGAYRHVGDRGRVLNEWQFVYLEAGSGWFTDENGVRRSVGSGDMLVIRPGVWHRYAPVRRTGWTERWVGFTGVTFDQALGAVGIYDGPGVVDCPEPGVVLTAHDELLDLAGINDASSHVSMVALILRMVGALGGSVARGARATYTPAIAASVQTMQTHLDGSLTVAGLASATGLSESAFRRRFAREIGMSPYHYYMTLRINQAKMELAHSTRALRDVAEQLGFTDAFHLSRTFKEYTGLSPSEWRAGGG